MRRAWLALMAAGAVSAAVATPALAREFPYCIKGCDFGAGAGDCSFRRYAASGNRLRARCKCAANPYFNARAEMQTDRSRQSRRIF